MIVGGGPARSDLQWALHGPPVTLLATSQAKRWPLLMPRLMCSPSVHDETFGEVVWEAMALGCCGRTAAEGVRDLVTDEQTGLSLAQVFLSEEEQVVEYRLRLSRLVYDQQARERLHRAPLAEARMRSGLAMERLLCAIRRLSWLTKSGKGLVG